MQTTANVTEAKRVRAAPTFSSTEVEKWDLLLRRDEAEWVLDQHPPTPDLHEAERLLVPDGEQTDGWEQFWKDQKECQAKWTRKNGIAYSAIVEGCEGHNGAMLVVMQRKSSDNAKELYDALMKKFRVHHTELANFNGLKMAPNESGSDFINRILEAKVKLSQYGYLDLQDDIHLLESNVKYAQLAMTLQCMSNVTWDGAVEQLTVHECLTMKNSADAKTETY